MKRNAILTFFTLFFNLFAYCQSDTLFWFAAPEVCQGNFQPYLDQPVRIVISTYSSAANITISQPANGSFVPITATIGANSMQTFDLTAFLTQLENAPANAVHNKGLLIQSTAPVTAYYEVVSPGNNPEIFSLKGNNALGTDFMIPTQNMFPNSANYNPNPPRNSFDIVATQNNTSITITPTQAIVGHAAGVPFILVLNQGQTYSATAISAAAADHLSGSRVISDKPIAITVKDDLIRPFGSSCADLMGDQIVPLTKIGYDHVIVRGFLNDPPNINNEDFVFVLATQNNTSISLNGSIVTTINQGVTYGTAFSGNSAFIQADKPVYVIHVSGTGCEMGQALVPPAPCSGSGSVSFTRTSGQNFGLILFTRAGAENGFSINTPLSITGMNFNPVPGSGGQWMAAMIPCNTNEIPISQNIRVTNSIDLFHLGIVNYGSAPGGCRYGYFSDYSSAQVGNDTTLYLCNGQLLLQADPADIYLWSNGSSSSFIMVTQPGDYSITRTVGTCTSTDSFHVVSSSTSFQLGPDAAICPNQTLVLNAPPGFSNYLWNTGQSGSSLSIQVPGVYSITAIDSTGCIVYDSIQISIYSEPFLLPDDTLICNTSAVTLSLAGYNSYLWSNGANQATITLNSAGTYWVTVLDTAGCSWTDSINVIQNASIPLDIGSDTLICPGSSVILSAGSGFDSYLWSNGLTSASIATNGSGMYWVLAESNGCFFSDTIYLSEISIPPFDLSNDTLQCWGNALLESGYSADSYLWNTGETSESISVDSSGTYLLTVFSNGCYLTDSVYVNYEINNSPSLGLDTVLCYGASIQLAVSPYLEAYTWSTGSTSSFTYVQEGGLYWISGYSCGNSFIDSILIRLIEDYGVYVPNTFTPDADNLNDVFYVKGLTDPPFQYHLMIFNRWGEEIFQSTDYQQVWDGTHKGKLCPSGVYVCSLELQTQCGEPRQILSKILLLK